MRSIYSFRGKIKKGKNRGKLLGFPTANIALHIPIPEGIYTATITMQGKTYNGLTFIGRAKTFGEKTYLSETYILDFDKEIYGAWATIRILKKIRGNKKFESEKSLILQMEADEKKARAFFNAL